MSWDLGPTLAAWLESRRPGRLPRLRRRRPRRQRPGPAVPPHDPAAGLGGRPADRDPLGPARLRGALRPAGRRGMWLPETRGRPGDAAAARRGRRRAHDPGAVAGRSIRTSRRAGPTASTWATAASIVVALYDARAVGGGLVRAARDGRRRRVRPRPARAAAGVRDAPRRRAAARRHRHRRRAVRPPPAVPRALPRAARPATLRRRGARLRRRPARPRRWPSRPAGRSGRSGPRRADVVELPPRRAALERRLRVRRRRPLEGAAAGGARAAGRGHRRADRAACGPDCRARPTRGRRATPTSTS